MPLHHLDALFKPAAVAVVAGDGTGVGAVLARNLLTAGFNGPVLPVSSRRKAIEGVLAYPSLADLPLVPDLCVVAAPPEDLDSLLRQAAAKGVRAVLAVSAGLPEHGGAAVESVRASLGRLARDLGVRLLGPDSLGLQVPALKLNASLAPVTALPGNLAFVSQSGAVANAVVDWAEGRGIGFSAVVSTGAMADADFADCLDHFSLNSSTRAILLYLEEVIQARRFLSAARGAARLKPVIVLRAGRHDESDAVYAAACRRAGMLRVHDLRELFDAAETLGLARPAIGDRLALLTNGGGIGAVAMDALIAAGGHAAVFDGASQENPVDLGADAGGERTAETLRRLLQDRGCDAALVLHGPSAFSDAEDTARQVAEVARKAVKPVLTCWLGERRAVPARHVLAEARLPTYDTPEEAVRAFLHVVEYRRAREALTQTPPSVPEDFRTDAAAARVVVAAALAEGRTVLGPAETDALLAAFALAEAPSGPGLPIGLRLYEHPRFGPVLRLGASGHSWVAALPPLNMLLAADALRLVGRDGGSAAAALVLVKLSQLAVEVGEVAELSAVLRGGALASVAVTVREFSGDPAARLAIRPYPKQLETPLVLPDGRAFVVRPVLPEDEPAFHDLFGRLTPEEIRLRFFAPKRELGHLLAARMTQLDYDREMALVVATPEAPGQARIIGVIHLNGDADGRRGEFAVMIETGMTGLGLGPLLMRRMLDHARASGLREVYGEVLRENRPMLKLCKVFGFEQKMSEDDPSVLHVRLAVRS